MNWATSSEPSRRISLKKNAETDAIFEQLTSVHDAAADDETILRLSIDAKATVKIGPFSRNGKSRTHVNAADHDDAFWDLST